MTGETCSLHMQLLLCLIVSPLVHGKAAQLQHFSSRLQGADCKTHGFADGSSILLNERVVPISPLSNSPNDGVAAGNDDTKHGSCFPANPISQGGPDVQAIYPVGPLLPIITCNLTLRYKDLSYRRTASLFLLPLSNFCRCYQLTCSCQLSTSVIHSL